MQETKNQYSHPNLPQWVTSKFAQQALEAERKLRYNLAWYRAEALKKKYVNKIVAGANDGSWNFDQNNQCLIRLDYIQKQSVDKLRFNNVISFLIFEHLTIKPATIQGLIDHYSQSKGCQPRLHFLNQKTGILERTNSEIILSVLQNEEILKTISTEEFILAWQQYEFEKPTKWGSYTNHLQK